MSEFCDSVPSLTVFCLLVLDNSSDDHLVSIVRWDSALLDEQNSKLH